MGKARKQTQCKLSTLKTRNLDRGTVSRISCDAVRGGPIGRPLVQDLPVKYS